MTDIRHTSDNAHLNNDNRTAAENWSYTRHLSKLADQAKQQTDLVPSSPRDTDSAPSSSQDRGKRPLSAQELLEEEWRRVEPGENGNPPEKLVIPDSGLRGGMDKEFEIIALGNKLIEYTMEGNHEKATEVCKHFAKKLVSDNGMNYREAHALSEFYEQFVARAGRDHPMIAQVLCSMLDEVKYCPYTTYDGSCLNRWSYDRLIPICERHFESYKYHDQAYETFHDKVLNALEEWVHISLCIEMPKNIERFIVMARGDNNRIEHFLKRLFLYVYKDKEMCHETAEILKRQFGPDHPMIKRFRDQFLELDYQWHGMMRERICQEGPGYYWDAGDGRIRRIGHYGDSDGDSDGDGGGGDGGGE